MQRREAALTGMVADGNTAARSVGSGRWSRRVIRFGGIVKMIPIEALPEKFII
jgi:hypothetical protein